MAQKVTRIQMCVNGHEYINTYFKPDTPIEDNNGLVCYEICANCTCVKNCELRRTCENYHLGSIGAYFGRKHEYCPAKKTI